MTIIHYVYGAHLSVLLYTSSPVLDEISIIIADAEPSRNLSNHESYRRLSTTTAE